MSDPDLQLPESLYRYRTLQALPEFTGSTTALLLHMLGYRTLWEIAASHHAAILTLPHIGEARFRQIEACLTSRGLAFDSNRDAACGFDHSV